MRTIKSIISISLIFCTLGLYSQSLKKIEKLKVDCALAKKEFIKSDFQMQDHFNNAYAYVIFPNVGKGGIGIGGAAGTGIVFKSGKRIGIANLAQLSIGFQFGGQAYREVIFFKGERQLNDLKKNKVKFSAQASAVAVTEGASANAKYDHGVMVFTMQKGGLMYEASVGGQKFKFKSFSKRKKLFKSKNK